MNLLIDIDGVICQYDFPKLTEKFFGIRIPNRDIFTYSLEDALGVSPEPIIKMFSEAAYYPPNLIKGAIKSLHHFERKGDNLLIYSNRLSFMPLPDLVKWLKKYHIPFSDIYAPDLHSLELHFHVDDCPRKLMEMGKETKRKLLFNNPWNRHCINVTGQLERVYTWKNVREVIDETRNG